MGQDVRVYINKESLKEMLEEDFEDICWLEVAVDGLRWHDFLERLKIPLESVPSCFLTSREVYPRLNEVEEKDDWQLTLFYICKRRDLIFRGEYSEIEVDKKKYASFYNLKSWLEEHSEQIIKGVFSSNET